MWNQLLKIGQQALSQGAQTLQKKGEELLNHAEYEINEIKAGRTDRFYQKAPQVAQTLSNPVMAPLIDSIYKGQELEGELLEKAGDWVEERTGIPSLATQIIAGVATPGAGEIKAGLRSASNSLLRRLPAQEALAMGPKTARKVRSVKPETALKMEARDRLVRTNTAPTRAEFPRNSDYRGIAGDVQGGLEGKPLRMENRPEYRQTQTGVSNPTVKDTNNFTPHHRMGIQDQQAFTAGLTPEQLKIRRTQLDEGGLYMGNRGENYTGLYDGKLSAKSKPKTGIDSTDHFDVHDLSDKMREKLGIKKGKGPDGKVDRTLDTWNGKLIKDMTPEQQFAMQAQLGFRDELIIDKVQTARYKALMDKFGHLSHEERRKLIINNPKAFASLSTKVQ